MKLEGTVKELKELLQKPTGGVQTTIAQPHHNTIPIHDVLFLDTMRSLGKMFGRPEVVQLHWETKKFCVCYDCSSYFGEVVA